MRHSTQIHSDAILATTPDHLLLTSLRAVLSTPQGSNPKATPATYILPVSELARFRTARSDHSTLPKRRLDFAVTDGTPSSPHSISLITSSPSSPSKARSAPTKPAPASGKSPESSHPSPRKDSSSWKPSTKISNMMAKMNLTGRLGKNAQGRSSPVKARPDLQPPMHPVQGPH